MSIKQVSLPPISSILSSLDETQWLPIPSHLNVYNDHHHHHQQQHHYKHEPSRSSSTESFQQPLHTLADVLQTVQPLSSTSPPLTSTSPSPSPSSISKSTTSKSSQETKHPRKYKCKTCFKCFTTSGHLARHSRIHTGERKHQCPFQGCEARFARQDNCMQHYRTHQNMKSRKRRIRK